MGFNDNSDMDRVLNVERLSEANSDAGLMSWEIKAYPQPTIFMDIGFGVLIILFVVFYLYGCLHEDEVAKDAITSSVPVPIAIFFIFWVGIVRQKTFYTYRITKKGGVVDYWLHFPAYAGFVFKGIAIFVLVAVLTMISIMPIMIFALVGIGAVTIPAALKLLAWENEVEHDGFEWERVQLVATDRSRNLVILQRRYDPDIPFEQNYLCFRVFLPKHRIDEFLDYCKVHAPSNVDFEEGKNIF